MGHSKQTTSQQSELENNIMLSHITAISLLVTQVVTSPTGYGVVQPDLASIGQLATGNKVNFNQPELPVNSNSNQLDLANFNSNQQSTSGSNQPASSQTNQAAAANTNQRGTVGSSIKCRTELVTLWNTKYTETETEVCATEYDEVCHTETERLCKPTTRQECEIEYETYTESECKTEYKEDCEYHWEGEGNDKVWAVIPGTCKSNPYDDCKDVVKQKARQVAYPVCRDVAENKCTEVPREVCTTVPDQECVNQPLKKCQDVPRQSCQKVHKKVPVRVSRQGHKKVCDDVQLPVVVVARDDKDLSHVDLRSGDAENLVFSG